MHPSVTYTLCATSPKEQTGDIITFTQFEEGDLLTKTRNDAESGDKSDEDSIMPPLLREEEKDAMDYSDESDDESMSAEILKDIHEGSQSHPSVNRREACYKICDCIKQRKSEQKVALKATKNMSKGLHKVFKTFVIYIS